MIRLARIEHGLDRDELQQLHEEYYENAGNTIEQIHATIRQLDQYLQGLDEERQGDGRFSTQPYEERRIDLSIGNIL
jgi:ABC-type transporter Mla subunit MlaD